MRGNVFGDLDHYKHHLVYCVSSQLDRVNLVTVQFFANQGLSQHCLVFSFMHDVKPQNHFMRVRKKHQILLLVSHKWV